MQGGGGSQEIEFVGATGARLRGRLRHPPGVPVGSALLAHCFTCSQDQRTVARLARALTDAGYLTMTFDMTGLGRSGGSFADTGFATSVGDVVRAAVALIERGAGPCVLVGHSLGGAAVVVAAERIHTVSAVVAVAPPPRVAHVLGLFDEDELERLRTAGRAEVCIGGRPFVVGRRLLDELDAADPTVSASRLEVPLLVVAGSADTIVPPVESRRVAEAAGERGSFVTVDGADHLFGGDTVDELASAIVDWLTRVRSGGT